MFNVQIAFDVVDFYPSILTDLLSTALDFASKYDNITTEERNIILHAKKSYLYNSSEHWGKKTSTNLFDVTMGSYESGSRRFYSFLVGSFLLHQITKKHGENFGFYRDDRLGLIKATPTKLKLSRKISAPSSIIMA
jgi:hypothetical protein